MNRKMFNVALGVIALLIAGIAGTPTSALAGLNRPSAANTTQTNPQLRTAAVPSAIRMHAKNRVGESPHGPWQNTAAEAVVGFSPCTRDKDGISKVVVHLGHKAGSKR